MSTIAHKTVAIQVWVDVDEEIVDLVRYLNTWDGLRTYTSCQGTIGEGGPEPHKPFVMVGWNNDLVFERIVKEFEISETGDHWCYIHPKK